MTLDRPVQISAFLDERQHADNEVDALWAALAANPQSRLAQDRSAEPDDLLHAVCRSHDRGYELLYGALTCLAPHVSNVCADRTAAGIQFLAHTAFKKLWNRNAPGARTVEGAFVVAMAEVLIDQAIDQLLDQLIVPAATRYVKEVCERWVHKQQLPTRPSDNILQCAAAVLPPQWIQTQCQSVAP